MPPTRQLTLSPGRQAGMVPMSSSPSARIRNTRRSNQMGLPPLSPNKEKSSTPLLTMNFLERNVRQKNGNDAELRPPSIGQRTHPSMTGNEYRPSTGKYATLLQKSMSPQHRKSMTPHHCSNRPGTPKNCVNLSGTPRHNSKSRNNSITRENSSPRQNSSTLRKNSTSNSRNNSMSRQKSSTPRSNTAALRDLILSRSESRGAIPRHTSMTPRRSSVKPQYLTHKSVTSRRKPDATTSSIQKNDDEVTVCKDDDQITVCKGDDHQQDDLLSTSFIPESVADSYVSEFQRGLYRKYGPLKMLGGADTSSSGS